MSIRLIAGLSLGILTLSCSSSPALKLTVPSQWQTYVIDREGGAMRLAPESLRFRPNLCDSINLLPEYKSLTEADLLQFLGQRQINLQIERARQDLVFFILTGLNTERPVRLRVALLRSPDEAGRELHEALLQHGPGAWGVHRSNLAVLGPAGSLDDVLSVGARTQLACWGVFTIADRDDTLVIPGGYTEL